MNPEFFFTPFEAFITFAAISFGFAVVLVWREISNTRTITAMRNEMGELRAQVNMLQKIVMGRGTIDSPGMAVNIGRLDDSTVVNSGRDGRVQ